MNPIGVTMHGAISAAREDPAAFIRLLSFSCSGFHADLQDLWSTESRSVVYAPVSAGKTQQNIWRLLWDIGNDPEIKIAFISATESLGVNVVSSLRSLMTSPVVRAVFPHLKMSETQPLNKTDGFRVERKSKSADPTFRVFGVLASEIQGARLDLVVADDVATHSNSLTAASREKLVRWFQASVLTRASVEGLRVRVLSNPHHKDALPEVLGRLDGWVLHRFLAQGPEGRLLAPELMSATQLERKRSEQGPFASAMIDCQTPAAGRSMFSGEGIARCLEAGEGVPLVRSFPPGAAPVFSGVDISGGVGRDRSALVTIAVLADGARRILDVRSSDRWNGAQLVEQMRDVHRAYGGIFGVESNATQSLISDLANDVPCVKITTTAALKRYGMLALATEWDNGGWIAPSHAGEPASRELAQLIAEMENYSASSHAGDRLMAALMAREVAARSHDVMSDHEGAERAADQLLAQYGIVDDSPEARFRQGRSAWAPIDTLRRN